MYYIAKKKPNRNNGECEIFIEGFKLEPGYRIIQTVEGATNRPTFNSQQAPLSPEFYLEEKLKNYIPEKRYLEYKQWKIDTYINKDFPNFYIQDVPKNQIPYEVVRRFIETSDGKIGAHPYWILRFGKVYDNPHAVFRVEHPENGLYSIKHFEERLANTKPNTCMYLGPDAGMDLEWNVLMYSSAKYWPYEKVEVFYDPKAFYGPSRNAEKLELFLADHDFKFNSLLNNPIRIISTPFWEFFPIFKLAINFPFEWMSVLFIQGFIIFFFFCSIIFTAFRLLFYFVKPFFFFMFNVVCLLLNSFYHYYILDFFHTLLGIVYFIAVFLNVMLIVLLKIFFFFVNYLFQQMLFDCSRDWWIIDWKNDYSFLHELFLFKPKPKKKQEDDIFPCTVERLAKDYPIKVIDEKHNIKSFTGEVSVNTTFNIDVLKNDYKLKVTSDSTRRGTNSYQDNLERIFGPLRSLHDAPGGRYLSEFISFTSRETDPFVATHDVYMNSFYTFFDWTFNDINVMESCLCIRSDYTTLEYFFVFLIGILSFVFALNFMFWFPVIYLAFILFIDSPTFPLMLVDYFYYNKPFNLFRESFIYNFLDVIPQNEMISRGLRPSKIITVENSYFIILGIPFFSLLWLLYYNLSTIKPLFKNFFQKGLYSSGLSFMFTIFFLFLWKEDMFGGYHYLVEVRLIPSFSNYFYMGVDGISIFFLVLINLFIFLTIFYLNNHTEDSFSALIYLLLLQVSLLGAFIFLELLSFFLFFEITLMPIFFLVLNFGSRNRRVRAIYLIALFTMLGSILILFNALYIHIKIWGAFYDLIISVLQQMSESFSLWNAFFIAFGIKMPIFPLHIWLPEAHVEAPTIGSVLLAALLLKLGSYGIFRFSFSIFPQMSWMMSPYAICLALLGILYTALTAIAQIDLKKIIAYSSVGHMCMVLLGLLAFTSDGVQGAFFQMLSHGIVSGALFFCVGSLYERFKVRSLKYFGGLTFFFPLLALIALIFFMANISFPLTSSFIGEFLILMGFFKHNFIITFFASISMVLGAVYMLWTYNRIFFGNLKIYLLKIVEDISRKEFYIFLILIFFLFWMGIRPDGFLDIFLLDSIQYIKESTFAQKQYYFHFFNNAFIE